MTRDELIRRLESEDPSPALQAALAIFLGWTRYRDGCIIHWLHPDGQPLVGRLPNWLKSIDAALTLVPKGFGWSLFVNDSLDTFANPIAEVWPLNGRADKVERYFGESNTKPAMALCAAALKAQEQAQETAA